MTSQATRPDDRNDRQSPYAQLHDLFVAQLSRTARFVRAAFHVHSVASHDWGKEADPTQNDPRRFAGPSGQRAFLDELARHLDIACVTDHMKARYACELARMAANRNDITVLPGMEVNARLAPGYGDRIHLVVVFPPDKDPDEIERIFADLGPLPGEERRTGQSRYVSPILASGESGSCTREGYSLPRTSIRQAEVIGPTIARRDSTR